MTASSHSRDISLYYVDLMEEAGITAIQLSGRKSLSCAAQTLGYTRRDARFISPVSDV